MPRDDLTARVKAGTLSASDATTLRKGRRRAAQLAKEREHQAELRDLRRAREAQEQERKHQEWLARQAEEKQMAPAWAVFILAHQPASAELVMDGHPMREIVMGIKKNTGCKVGECDHRPLTREDRERLLPQLAKVAEAEGDTPAEAAEKAELILDYAPTMVLASGVSA